MRQDISIKWLLIFTQHKFQKCCYIKTTRYIRCIQYIYGFRALIPSKLLSKWFILDESELKYSCDILPFFLYLRILFNTPNACARFSWSSLYYICTYTDRHDTNKDNTNTDFTIPNKSWSSSKQGRFLKLIVNRA